MRSSLNSAGRGCILEVEEEEEYFVNGEENLSIIIMENWDTMLETIQILCRHVHIVKHWTTLLKGDRN